MATTPEPPYVAVIFTSKRTADDDAGYARATARMEELAAKIPGFLGIESARGEDGSGITVSYWANDDAVTAWRTHPEHLEIQARGRQEWYSSYELRVARVEQARSFSRRAH